MSINLHKPVLVLGWVPRIVATIARSLHNHGVPVDVATFMSEPHIRSRAIRDSIDLPNPALNAAGFLSGLLRFIEQRGHDMIIPTDDNALTALLDCYDELAKHTYVACPPPNITSQILNKESTLKAAQDCGITTPQTMVVTNTNQLGELARRMSFPWILKPAEKQKRVDEFKNLRISSVAEIGQRFPMFHQFSVPVLVQESCHGVGVGIEVLMHNGDCRAVFQHRRLKELPYRGGYGVTAIAEEPDSRLVNSSLKLLRALQWEGPAMVEFKVDQELERSVLMEINGRYWGSISLPVRSGIDFPLLHWKLVHGEMPDVPEHYSYGTRWRWTVGYFARFRELIPAAKQSARAKRELIRSLLDMPRDLGPWTHDALFQFLDPSPAIQELWNQSRFYWKQVKQRHQ